MTPEFRRNEMNIGPRDHVLVCRACVSNYRVAAANECGCRAANAAVGQSRDFEIRVGERDEEKEDGDMDRLVADAERNAESAIEERENARTEAEDCCGY